MGYKEEDIIAGLCEAMVALPEQLGKGKRFSTIFFQGVWLPIHGLKRVLKKRLVTRL